MGRIANGKAGPDIVHLREFQGSNFRGETGPFNEIMMGRLNHEEGERLNRDFVGIDYVVYSYGTPIAWHVVGQPWAWYTVNQKFSTTTTRHQSIVRHALLQSHMKEDES